MSDVAGAVQQQAQALGALPGTLRGVERALRDLVGVLAGARETVQAAQRVAVRADALLDELEGPLRDLAPGLRRVAAVLDDPVVDTLPETLRVAQAQALPVLASMSDTHARVVAIASTVERLTGVADEIQAAAAVIPGAGWLSRMRGPATAAAPRPPRTPPPPPAATTRAAVVDDDAARDGV